MGVALGSNLGDRLRNLRGARDAILALPQVEPGGVLTAPIYETVPVNCPSGAGRFLNSVLEFSSVAEPASLLGALLAIEAAFGREREPGHASEPRRLDLDLLYAGGLILRSPALTLPHPRMLRRRFVLAPLAHIRPDFVLPGQERPVAEILRRLDDDPSGVALTAEQW